MGRGARTAVVRLALDDSQFTEPVVALTGVLIREWPISATHTRRRRTEFAQNKVRLLYCLHFATSRDDVTADVIELASHHFWLPPATPRSIDEDEGACLFSPTVGLVSVVVLGADGESAYPRLYKVDANVAAVPHDDGGP